MAAKTEPTERQSAGATAGSGDMLHKFDERLRALKDLQHTSSQQTPVEDLHGSDDKSNKQLEELKGQLEDLLRPGPQRGPVEDLPSLIPRDHSKSALTSPSTIRITDRLDDETSDRVQTIKSQRKKRTSRGFARYLGAICIGVGATVAWQSYGDAAKQMIATSAPELGWSPEAKQMIASWVQAGPSSPVLKTLLFSYQCRKCRKRRPLRKPAVRRLSRALRKRPPPLLSTSSRCRCNKVSSSVLPSCKQLLSSSLSARIGFYVRSPSCIRKSLTRSQRLRRRDP
jgi:hypothetical protein